MAIYAANINDCLDEAFDDVRNGRVHKADSVDAMFNKILGLS